MSDNMSMSFETIKSRIDQFKANRSAAEVAAQQAVEVLKNKLSGLAIVADPAELASLTLEEIAALDAMV